MSHATRTALAAVLATALVAAPFATAGLADPVAELLLTLYADVVSPVDDLVDAALLQLSALVGEARETGGPAALAATDAALGAVDGQVQNGRALSAAMVNGGAGTARNLLDAAEDTAGLAPLAAALAQAEGDALTSRATGTYAVASDTARALGERRASGLQATEEAVLVPLPGAIGDAYSTIPDPRIPIVVIIPEENPQLLNFVDDPTAVPYWDLAQFLDATETFAIAVTGTPGEVVEVTDAYLGGSVDAVNQEAYAAIQDTFAVADTAVDLASL